MITGDHHNIGKELARQIDLGTDIRTPDCLHPPSEARDFIVLQADGFAKVKPLDKQEVVSVLQDKGLVVGMTGDGVNDAPALAKAQAGKQSGASTHAAHIYVPTFAHPSVPFPFHFPSPSLPLPLPVAFSLPLPLPLSRSLSLSLFLSLSLYMCQCDDVYTTVTE